jgi:hypothetical protein
VYGRVTSGSNPVVDAVHGGTGQSVYAVGDLLYADTTTTLARLATSSSGYVLISGGPGIGPSWATPAASANIAGGTTGSIVYQSAASTTAFLSLGTTDYVLTAGASAPQYVAQATLSVGSATTATNIAGGAANSIPYQTGSGATTFLAQGTGVLQETAGAPSWTTTPTLTGTNFSGIPNGALTNSSITVTGGTGLGVAGSPVALGGTVTLSNTGVTSNVAGTGISVSSGTGAVTVSLSGTSALTSNAVTLDTTTTTFTSGTVQTVDTVATASFRTIKYLVQVTDSTGSKYHGVEIIIVHDGTTAYKTEYAAVTSAGVLGTFDASIATGNLTLQFTPGSSSTYTVKVAKLQITV